MGRRGPKCPEVQLGMGGSMGAMDSTQRIGGPVGWEEARTAVQTRLEERKQALGEHPEAEERHPKRPRDHQAPQLAGTVPEGSCGRQSYCQHLRHSPGSH